MWVRRSLYSSKHCMGNFKQQRHHWAHFYAGNSDAISLLQNLATETIRFIQDEARPHRKSSKVFLFRGKLFDNRVIALDYQNETAKGIDCPLYSEDLNVCEFFLWGSLKGCSVPKKSYHDFPTSSECR